MAGCTFAGSKFNCEYWSNTANHVDWFDLLLWMQGRPALVELVTFGDIITNILGGWLEKPVAAAWYETWGVDWVKALKAADGIPGQDAVSPEEWAAIMAVTGIPDDISVAQLYLAGLSRYMKQAGISVDWYGDQGAEPEPEPPGLPAGPAPPPPPPQGGEPAPIGAESTSDGAGMGLALLVLAAAVAWAASQK